MDEFACLQFLEHACSNGLITIESRQIGYFDIGTLNAASKKRAWWGNRLVRIEWDALNVFELLKIGLAPKRERIVAQKMSLSSRYRIRVCENTVASFSERKTCAALMTSIVECLSRLVVDNGMA
jgi:hypothetical protein